MFQYIRSLFLKKRLIILVDSLGYIKKNCYQSQVYKTLKNEYFVSVYTLNEIKNSRKLKLCFNFSLKKKSRIPKVISLLKLRTLYQSIDVVSNFLGDIPLLIYEQDPWQAFMDHSPYLGSYEIINKKINVKSFLTTSLWWSNFIKKRNLPSTFVRMGMLQNYCSYGKKWDERSIRYGFIGTMHGHRKLFFEKLRKNNILVDILPYSPYNKFLKNLQNIRIYIHTENSPWIVDGKKIPRNALWIKETEAAARGCFVIRDYEIESKAYDISNLPTKFIESLPSAEKNRRIEKAVAEMKSRNDWHSIISAIESI